MRPKRGTPRRTVFAVPDEALSLPFVALEFTMMRVFVTRAAYDCLVRSCGLWMRDEWPKLHRNWSIGGVYVWGHSPTLEALTDRLVEHCVGVLRVGA